MSAFVISQNDMHAVVLALCATGEADAFLPTDGNLTIAWPSLATRLGRKLYAMNIAAVTARYGDRDDLPGPCDPGLRDYPATYTAPDETGPLTLDCWIVCRDEIGSLAYQCAEGDIPETWPEYELLISARDRIQKTVAAMERESAMAVAAERAKNPPRHIGIVETAKIIRSELKAAFPGVKFSVRSDRYSMGSHIDVRWTDGPSKKAVEAITDQRYGTGFDGMTDSTTYHDGTYQGKPAHFAGSRPSCSREITSNLEAKMAAAWDKLSGQEQCDLLNRFDFPRWPEDRPGYRLAIFLSV